MDTVTRAKLVRIGNSRGVRIPKVMIEQLDLGPEVDLVVIGDHLEVRRGRVPRSGWGEQFRAMHEHGDDKLLDDVQTSTWDDEEWEW